MLEEVDAHRDMGVRTIACRVKGGRWERRRWGEIKRKHVSGVVGRGLEHISHLFSTTLWIFILIFYLNRSKIRLKETRKLIWQNKHSREHQTKLREGDVLLPSDGPESIYFLMYLTYMRFMKIYVKSTQYDSEPWQLRGQGVRIPMSQGCFASFCVVGGGRRHATQGDGSVYQRAAFFTFP